MLPKLFIANIDPTIFDFNSFSKQIACEEFDTSNTPQVNPRQIAPQKRYLVPHNGRNRIDKAPENRHFALPAVRAIHIANGIPAKAPDPPASNITPSSPFVRSKPALISGI